GDGRAKASGHETILLVEDEETVRQMTRLVLQHGGYEVLEAADGVEALAQAERHQGPIHLLLTDLVMPRLSGREVAGRLVGQGRVARVLFVSGYSEEATAVPGSAASDFLHKPFSLDGLTRKVREVLDRPGEAGQS